MTTNELHDTDWQDDLPLLTEIVEETTPHDVATVSAAAPDETFPAAPHEYSEEKLQLLLQQLETHVETVFADRLRLRLEHLHQQAVELTVTELKAELPGLVRNALHAATGSETPAEPR